MKSARDLLDAVGVSLKRYAHGEHRAACPRCAFVKHHPGDTALSVKIDDKGYQLQCFRCAWSAHGFYDRREPITPKVPRRRVDDSAEKAEREKAYITKVLGETQPAAGTGVQSYLQSRRIEIIPACIRCHPAHWHTDLKRTLLTMIAPLRDIVTNEVVGLHRTYLSDDATKITDGTARKMFGRHKGAVVKLTPDLEVEQGLAIAEGLETSLTVMQAGYPTWATGDANGIADFPVLAGVESLTIFADADGAGLKAARACAERWRAAGQEARVLIPPADGTDWNDFARAAT